MKRVTMRKDGFLIKRTFALIRSLNKNLLVEKQMDKLLFV
jgi:hypothetical protein